MVRIVEPARRGPRSSGRRCRGRLDPGPVGVLIPARVAVAASTRGRHGRVGGRAGAGQAASVCRRVPVRGRLTTSSRRAKFARLGRAEGQVDLAGAAAPTEPGRPWEGPGRSAADSGYRRSELRRPGRRDPDVVDRRVAGCRRVRDGDRPQLAVAPDVHRRERDRARVKLIRRLSVPPPAPVRPTSRTDCSARCAGRPGGRPDAGRGGVEADADGQVATGVEGGADGGRRPR